MQCVLGGEKTCLKAKLRPSQRVVEVSPVGGPLFRVHCTEPCLEFFQVREAGAIDQVECVDRAGMIVKVDRHLVLYERVAKLVQGVAEQ